MKGSEEVCFSQETCSYPFEKMVHCSSVSPVCGFGFSHSGIPLPSPPPCSLLPPPHPPTPCKPSWTLPVLMRAPSTYYVPFTLLTFKFLFLPYASEPISSSIKQCQESFSRGLVGRPDEMRRVQCCAEASQRCSECWGEALAAISQPALWPGWTWSTLWMGLQRSSPAEPARGRRL